MEKKELYTAWIKAKKAEEKAKKSRIEIESQIEPLLPAFDETSKTLHEDGFTLKIKKNETYSFDQEAWKSIRQSIPDELRPEKIKFEVDKTGFNYLKENNPQVYKQVSDVITFKVGKSTFSIEKE